MNPDDAIREAISFLTSVPGYDSVGHELLRHRVRFVPSLTDRGQATLGGTILIGPETLEGAHDTVLVSLAGTLVHEHWHTRQNHFLKTLSFWSGVATRTQPMRRYEWPAYARQLAFLKTIAAAQSPLSLIAERERAAVAAAFQAVYGPIPGPDSV